MLFAKPDDAAAAIGNSTARGRRGIVCNRAVRDCDCTTPAIVNPAPAMGTEARRRVIADRAVGDVEVAPWPVRATAPPTETLDELLLRRAYSKY